MSIFSYFAAKFTPIWSSVTEFFFIVIDDLLQPINYYIGCMIYSCVKNKNILFKWMQNNFFYKSSSSSSSSSDFEYTFRLTYHNHLNEWKTLTEITSSPIPLESVAVGDLFTIYHKVTLPKINFQEVNHALLSRHTAGEKKWKYKILKSLDDVNSVINNKTQLHEMYNFSVSQMTKMCFLYIEVITTEKRYSIQLPAGIYYDKNEILCSHFLRRYFKKENWNWTHFYQIEIMDSSLHNFILESFQYIEITQESPGYIIQTIPQIIS